MTVLKHQNTGRILLALTFMVLLLPLAQAEDSNKWRIKIKHSANSDGEMVFRVTPKNDPPIDVSVKIGKGTREKRVANDVENAFKQTLPKSKFHVERDDFEDVLVKKDPGEDNFGLELISNTVEGVNLRIHKE
jgi:hypothetical protein